MSDWKVEADGFGGYHIVHDRDTRPSGSASRPSRKSSDRHDREKERSKKSKRKTHISQSIVHGDLRRHNTWPGWRSTATFEDEYYDAGRESTPHHRSEYRYEFRSTAPPACPEPPPVIADPLSHRRKVRFAHVDGRREESEERELPPRSDDPRAQRLRERLSRSNYPSYPPDHGAGTSSSSRDRRTEEAISSYFDALKLHALEHMAAQRASNARPKARYDSDDERGRRRRR